MTDKLDQDIKEFAAATKGLWFCPAERSFTPEEKLSAIDREIAIRRRVYPNRVLTRRMSQKLADQQIAVMEAIAADIRGAMK